MKYLSSAAAIASLGLLACVLTATSASAALFAKQEKASKWPSLGIPKLTGSTSLKSDKSKPGMFAKAQNSAKKMTSATKRVVMSPFKKKSSEPTKIPTGYQNVRTKTPAKKSGMGSWFSKEESHPSKTIGDFMSAPKP